MRKNIKQDIIQTAKELFNQRGYNQVSTQDIANALGISKGNLNYHFKRKEDIISAIVEEMHRHFVPQPAPTTLEELNALFLHAQTITQENAFFFWHYLQLSQVSETIRTIQHSMIKHNYSLFTQAFETLRADGILQEEEYPRQYRQIIRAVMLTCIYWAPHNKLEEGLDTGETFLSCVWGILYPLLTPEGKRQYQALAQTF